MANSPTMGAFIGLSDTVDLGLTKGDKLVIIVRTRPGIQSDDDQIIDLGQCTPSRVANIQSYLGQLLTMAKP